jgi:hypothetical protein
MNPILIPHALPGILADNAGFALMACGAVAATIVAISWLDDLRAVFADAAENGRDDGGDLDHGSAE